MGNELLKFSLVTLILLNDYLLLKMEFNIRNAASFFNFRISFSNDRIKDEHLVSQLNNIAYLVESVTDINFIFKQAK